jgi:hypothetical protein
MKLTAVAAVAALGVTMSGCASIIAGTSQDISVSTPPAEGARCVLSSRAGSSEVTTPGVVHVEKSGHDIQASCAKAGFAPASTIIASGVEPWTFGNIIFGGLIGVVVDWATGAIHKYPSHVQIPMQPTGPAEAPMQPYAPGNPGS